MKKHLIVFLEKSLFYIAAKIVQIVWKNDAEQFHRKIKIINYKIIFFQRLSSVRSECFFRKILLSKDLHLLRVYSFFYGTSRYYRFISIHSNNESHLNRASNTCTYTFKYSLITSIW